jgi:hypothetical protein
MPGTAFKNSYEPPDSVKSMVVHYDQALSQTVPALRFPNAGRVLGAYLFSDVSSSGTNLLQAGLKNGGATGAGTIQTAPLTNGTVIAGSAYALTINTGGPEIYQAGELCMLQVTTTMANTDFKVQIDYHLDVLP